MASDVCNIFIFTGRKNKRVRERTVWEIDLCGEAGEACNNVIFSGKKNKNKSKKTKNKNDIDLCGCSAWNEPCVSKKINK